MKSGSPRRVLTDGGSQTTDGHECPDCGGNSLDESVESLAAVCDDCGCVIPSYADPAKRLESDKDEENSWTKPERSSKQYYQRDWADVCAPSNSTEANIIARYETLEELADALDLSAQVRKRAATIIATASVEDHIDGRSGETVVAALTSIAAREIGEPRPIAAVAENIKKDKARINKLRRSLYSELDLDYQPSSPKDFVPYLSKELGYAEDVEHRSQQVLDRAEAVGLTTGRDPAGCAGAALYLASDGEQTQRSVATAIGVTTETIRVRLKEFREEGVHKHE